VYPARLKGESVEEEGYKAAAVIKCLSSAGERSWGDLQLLSRAKSVLVLRHKNLAASTIGRVESELTYEAGLGLFIFLLGCFIFVDRVFCFCNFFNL
jgi:hypothetical protein